MGRKPAPKPLSLADTREKYSVHREAVSRHQYQNKHQHQHQHQQHYGPSQSQTQYQSNISYPSLSGVSSEEKTSVFILPQTPVSPFTFSPKLTSPTRSISDHYDASPPPPASAVAATAVVTSAGQSLSQSIHAYSPRTSITTSPRSSTSHNLSDRHRGPPPVSMANTTGRPPIGAPETLPSSPSAKIGATPKNTGAAASGKRIPLRVSTQTATQPHKAGGDNYQPLVSAFSSTSLNTPRSASTTAGAFASPISQYASAHSDAFDFASGRKNSSSQAARGNASGPATPASSGAGAGPSFHSNITLLSRHGKGDLSSAGGFKSSNGAKSGPTSPLTLPMSASGSLYSPAGSNGQRPYTPAHSDHGADSRNSDLEKAAEMYRGISAAMRYESQDLSVGSHCRPQLLAEKVMRQRTKDSQEREEMFRLSDKAV
ncbi:hypothetical protein CFIMG_002548RAa [Ceratocystis fimbriata CBS 114723]|uniref:Uncharacterized protein n=1 Tax=Ceratocystis fimbriata CBS 114723 TaxID=1035309 RepID=A0A2C5XAV5_9PEZI|nr:hypothetical protein CFIMG_002548RAa [Ceratocystis fimbriata CBS 114723]